MALVGVSIIISIPHCPKTRLVYIERCPHFQKWTKSRNLEQFHKKAKIGVSIIVSIPHWPGFASRTMWNTNDDRYSDFCHFFLKMWKRLYRRLHICGFCLFFFCKCGNVSIYMGFISRTAWNTNDDTHLIFVFFSANGSLSRPGFDQYNRVEY